MFHVNSEVGQLKQVILHRPDLSLRRLTPRNCKQLLFDDVLWVSRARQEHDVFQDVLRDNGVEVFLLLDLLTETMKNANARSWLLDRRITEIEYGPEFSLDLKPHLSTLNAADLAKYLIGGITKVELRLKGNGLGYEVLYPDSFILPPLPNHLFTRDTSCWIYNGVSINPMAKLARQHETINLHAIYRFHPMFSEQTFDMWYGHEKENYGKASIEGGDVLVLGFGVVLIGMGERTTPQAIVLLAQSLFLRQAVREIIVVELPKARSAMHLDTVLTMLDVDKFSIYPGVFDRSRIWTLKPGEKKKKSS